MTLASGAGVSRRGASWSGRTVASTMTQLPSRARSRARASCVAQDDGVQLDLLAGPPVAVLVHQLVKRLVHVQQDRVRERPMRLDRKRRLSRRPWTSDQDDMCAHTISL